MVFLFCKNAHWNQRCEDPKFLLGSNSARRQPHPLTKLLRQPILAVVDAVTSIRRAFGYGMYNQLVKLKKKIFPFMHLHKKLNLNWNKQNSSKAYYLCKSSMLLKIKYCK